MNSNNSSPLADLLGSLMGPNGQAILDQLAAANSQPSVPVQPLLHSFPSDSGGVTVEALLNGSFIAQHQQQQQPAFHHDPSPLFQLFQQNSMQNASTANPQQHQRVTDTLESNFAPRAQGIKQATRASPPVLPPVRRPSTVKKLNQRQEFFVLVKVLFGVLKANRDTDRLVRAKAIIAECTHRNRTGDAAFSNLQGSVESRLRQTVGEVYWSQAKDRMDRSKRQARGAIRQQKQGVVAVAV